MRTSWLKLGSRTGGHKHQIVNNNDKNSKNSKNSKKQ